MDFPDSWLYEFSVLPDVTSYFTAFLLGGCSASIGFLLLQSLFNLILTENWIDYVFVRNLNHAIISSRNSYRSSHDISNNDNETMDYDIVTTDDDTNTSFIELMNLREGECSDNTNTTTNIELSISNKNRYYGNNSNHTLNKSNHSTNSNNNSLPPSKMNLVTVGFSTTGNNNNSNHNNHHFPTASNTTISSGSPFHYDHDTNVVICTGINNLNNNNNNNILSTSNHSKKSSPVTPRRKS